MVKILRPSRARVMSTEKSVRRPVGGSLTVGWLVWEGINKFWEHVIFSWLVDRFKEEPSLLTFVRWTIDHPFWFLLILAGVYLAIVAARTMLSGEEEQNGEATPAPQEPVLVNATASVSGAASRQNVVQGLRDNTGEIQVGDHYHFLAPPPSSLPDPILHIEPETGMIECDGGVRGNFTVRVVSTGIVDLTNIRIYLDMFFAQRTSEGITVKKVGPNFVGPTQTFDCLTRNMPVDVPIRFANLVPIIHEVGERSGMSGIPSMSGVRICVDARRKDDGKDFSFVGAYLMIPSGDLLLPPTQEPSIAGILRLIDVMPHLQTKANWGSVATHLHTNPDGSVSSWYE